LLIDLRGKPAIKQGKFGGHVFAKQNFVLPLKTMKLLGAPGESQPIWVTKKYSDHTAEMNLKMVAFFGFG